MLSCRSIWHIVLTVFFFCSSNCMCEVEMRHMYNVSILNERRLDQRSPTSEANGTFITKSWPLLFKFSMSICITFQLLRFLILQFVLCSALDSVEINLPALNSIGINLPALDSVEINLCLYIHLEMPIHGKPRRLLSWIYQKVHIHVIWFLNSNFNKNTWLILYFIKTSEIVCRNVQTRYSINMW